MNVLNLRFDNDMTLIVQVLLLFIVSITLHILYGAFFSPHSRFPGPLLAKFTNIWRLLNVWGGQHHETLRRLHKAHGNVVRVGPNLLSLSHPHWIRIIYSTKGEFKKTDAYIVNDVNLGQGKVVPTTFSVLDNETHAAMMKPMQKLYGVNNILSYEAQIDEVLELFKQALDSFVDGRVIDIGLQLTYTAYDVIGNMTLGIPAGYLENQCDFEGTLEVTDRVWDYFARVYQMPWLDRWLAKNCSPWIANRFASFGENMHRTCAELTLARIQQSDEVKRRDFLEDFIAIGGGRENPDMGMIIAWLSSNVVAGSETVAIALKAAAYFILKHPPVMKKLQRELDDANLSLPISYRQTKDKLPYLEAIIKESMRLHPGVGLLLERVVPDGGVQLPDGPFLEAGTHVGMNAWVVHLDSIFGPNTEAFLPERWLPQDDENEDAYKARVRRMSEADIAFGAGRRICSGKFVAQVEIPKVLATLFLLYDLKLADQDMEWRVTNSWFVRQDGIQVHIQRRRDK